jgi:hypothetical protein
MSVNLYAVVTAWLANRAMAELSTDGFAQIDLDELLGNPPPHASRTVLSCLDLAVILARQEEPQVDGVLTIPLPGADSLTRDSPTLEDALALPSEYDSGRESPGLSLVEEAVWRAYEPVEEYRRHLGADAELPPGCAAYYRTWRSLSDAERDWPFARTIYIRTLKEPLEAS